MRRTKIVATIGPAIDTPEAYDALVVAGIDVARLNASHASVTELQNASENVRAAAERAGRHVAVLVDLAGPKLRLSEVAADTTVTAGQQLELVDGGGCIGDAHAVCVDHPALSDAVSPGDRILINDGRIELAVRETR